MNEKILCIKGEYLFENGKWNGLITSDKESYLELLREKSEFRVRKDLEKDSTYKQIIGQVVLRHNGKYYLHRQVKKNEERLDSLCPLALGGHIEKIDVKKGEDIFEVAVQRELSEEVELGSKIINREYLGLVYIEDGHSVCDVHVGLVYVYDLDGMNVHVNEEGLEDIGFVSLDYLKTNTEKLTYWSRIIIYHL